MGKSGFCLKLLRCGGKSADRDDFAVSENRSRSEHRPVLSNTVAYETPPLHKEPEDVVKFQQCEISINHEETSTLQIIEEKLQKQPAESESTEVAVAAQGTEGRKIEPVTVASDETEVGGHDESGVVIVQAAVRGHLAQKKLKELKSVIKLQAAVRGHLVRRHAIGALRCAQGIVKMQILVRNRFGRQSDIVSFEKKTDGGYGNDDQGRVSKKSRDSSTSIEKLLSNRFARQLMESTQKTKPIKIKCDPLKPNSAWNWLERWMSVSPVEPKVKLETTNEPENEKTETHSLVTEAPCKVAGEPAHIKFNDEGTTVLPDCEEKLIYSDSRDLKFDACQPALVKEVSGGCEISKTGTSNPEETSVELHPILDPLMQMDVNSESSISYPLYRPETDTEQVKHSSEISVAEQTKFITESRKASNPALKTADSKFEELSSTSSAVGLMSASDQDVRAELSTNVSSSTGDTLSKTNEPGMAETPVHDLSRVGHGDTDFGTGGPACASTALDSPGRSEVAAKGCDAVDDETSSSAVPNLSNLETERLEKPVSGGGESMDSETVARSAEVMEHQQHKTSDFQTEPNIGAADQVYTSYPEASPKSHTSISVQGTPSSQVSVKRGKSELRGHKRKSLSANKGSPANPSYGSGPGSGELLAKEQKNGKRRNSFGSPKADTSDQNPKDISRGHSLPRFMQATESARAKINANGSPRSSPDVHDQETHIKKRDSLPVANTRQDSPGVQMQPNAKEKERKWLR